LNAKTKKITIKIKIFRNYHKYRDITIIFFRFELFTNNQLVFVPYGKETISIGKPNPNKSIMVWGAISRYGKLNLVEVVGNMN
jgi:hypothetical protein